MDKVVRRVEGKVSAQNLDKCILIYDGWTSHSVHYFDIFAAYRDSENNLQFPLLALSPLHDEASLDAQSYEFIVSTLSIFNKSLSSILAVVCDNENTNKALAKLLKIPMIGCASQRHNLAVNNFLLPHENLISKVHAIMVKMSNLKRAGALRRKNVNLQSIFRNKTRWSSTYEMLVRYKALRPHLPENDLELLPYFLSEDLLLDNLLLDLTKIFRQETELAYPTFGIFSMI